MLAASAGKAEVAESLIKAGVDVNAQNGYGKTALDIAHFNRQTEVESLLKSAEQQNSDLKNTSQETEEKSTYEVTDKPKDDTSITVTNAMFNKKNGR